MTGVVVFHHVLGLTDGVRSFAARLTAAGHEVHTPDLFEGATFASIDEGLAHAQTIGFEVVVERGRLAAQSLPSDVVHLGFSMGVMPAQLLAQTRPGALGAVLCHSSVPPSELGEAWPESVPVQVHGMDADPFFVDGGDVDAAREIVASAPDAELFLYPGSAHLFADDSTPDFDADAAALLTERVLTLLARVG